MKNSQDGDWLNSIPDVILDNLLSALVSNTSDSSTKSDADLVNLMGAEIEKRKNK